MGTGINVVPCRPPPPGGADAGTVKLTGRDITSLVLCAEQYGARYDLLAAALDVRPDRLQRRSWPGGGTPATPEPAPSAPAPPGAWLTGAGMTVAGLGYPAVASGGLGRLAHIRAVLAVRLWLEVGRGVPGGAGVVAQRTPPPGRDRRTGGHAHIPDAEVHWPSLDASPYAALGRDGPVGRGWPMGRMDPWGGMGLWGEAGLWAGRGRWVGGPVVGGAGGACFSGRSSRRRGPRTSRWRRTSIHRRGTRRARRLRRAR